MKSAIFACLFAVALAAPQQNPLGLAEVLVDERVDNGDGTFQYNFQTSNDISGQRTGSIGSAGQSNIAGGYRFVSPEGETVEVTYVADENGYQPQSPYLPTEHPLPAHVYELLAIAEQQRAQGIQFDNRGFRLN
ncbi:cuticle protein AM1159-like [Penaeus japonicus]|uniref:cuticle protein AM1159-like n=1 Tax=Penaeus japonicus TaxID=27405 RepID=UPI001C70CF19|nr:cuticle protein AM1159-like [Penaeus japonicus]